MSDVSENNNSGQKIWLFWPDLYLCSKSDSRFLECVDKDRNQVDEKSIHYREERA